MSQEIFQLYSGYYNLLYRDKDYQAEAEYVSRALEGGGGRVKDVLEFGSGTGRHGRLLAQRGFNVTGVERSETMASAARKSAQEQTFNNGSFECVLGDIRTVYLDRVFDAVLSLFHVVSYQTGNDDLLKTFINAARHLRPGGIFLFDVWHGPAVLSDRPSVRIKRVEDSDTRLTRIAEPEIDTNANMVTVRYTVLAESKADEKLITFKEEHLMRYLFPTEIGLLASQAGFEVELSEEFLTGLKPSESTWGVAYLLRKSS
jgi:SAM-dependent methyltransferase